VLLDRSHVLAAADRIRGQVHRTPTLRCDAIDELAGAEVFMKAESLQRIGAFKARGALHAVGKLEPEQRARGVITYSSGNHAQAVALAARLFGVSADIAMPVDAPKVKVDVVRALGARITFAGHTSTDRRTAALEIEARTGGVIIEPFDHPDIIAGQGTATLELLEQVGELMGDARLDAVIVPVGGGGLIAGACLATAGTDTRVYAAEPVGCDAFGRSLAAGKIVAVEPGPTLADGLKPTRIGALNFEIAHARVAGAFTVDDAELGRAVAVLMLRAKLVVEPSGAAALAVALRRAVPDAQRIGVILSGGNVAPELLARLLGEYG
jgi:threonine dehydratase